MIGFDIWISFGSLKALQLIAKIIIKKLFVIFYQAIIFNFKCQLIYREVQEPLSTGNNPLPNKSVQEAISINKALRDKFILDNSKY